MVLVVTCKTTILTSKCEYDRVCRDEDKRIESSQSMSPQSPPLSAPVSDLVDPGEWYHCIHIIFVYVLYYRIHMHSSP